MENDPLEKRLFPRTRIKTSLRYQLRGTSTFSNAVCDDISLVGIGFVNNEFLPRDAMVSIEISVMSKVLRAIGRIAWSQPLPHSNRFRTGIQFVEFDPSEKSYLSEYIDMQLEHN
jgi:hypothetical protein